MWGSDAPLSVDACPGLPTLLPSASLSSSSPSPSTKEAIIAATRQAVSSRLGLPFSLCNTWQASVTARGPSILANGIPPLPPVLHVLPVLPPPVPAEPPIGVRSAVHSALAASRSAPEVLPSSGHHPWRSSTAPGQEAGLPGARAASRDSMCRLPSALSAAARTSPLLGSEGALMNAAEA